MSSCRAGLHRDPLILYSPCQDFKRASGMPFDACLYLVEDLEQRILFSVACDMALNNQSSAKEGRCNGATKKGLSPSDNQPRKPLGMISPNTMCNTTGVSTSDNLDIKTKNVPASIIQHTDDESTADSCVIIKPGNTKEKIAFFASHHCSNNRNNSMKVKNTGDVSGRAAKRRKKSVDLKRGKGCLQEVHKKCFLSDSFPSGIENCSINYFANADGVLSSQPVSVIEMVAFLEQRTSALLSDCTKPFSNSPSRPAGHSKCAHLGVSLMALEVSDETPNKSQSEKCELESVCVLEMVAKLESECLRHQNERESGGLSRSNSLRRNVGRVLLANGSQENANIPTEPSLAHDPENALAAPAMVNIPQIKEDLCSVNLWEDSHSFDEHQDSESLLPMKGCFAAKVSLELVKETYRKMGCTGETVETVDPCKCSISLCIKDVECVPDSLDCVNDLAADEKVEPSDGIPDSSSVRGSRKLTGQSFNSVCRNALVTLTGDPSPGKIFFQNAPKHSHAQVSPEVKSQTFNLERKTFDNTLCLQNSTMIAQYSVSISSLGNVSQVLDTSTIKRQVSHDFLETRFKIQQLLEPQPYMAFLPHHILVKIFHYLPTRTLAALKCTSCYFKFIVEHYDIRPCDSLWVRDPRYRDDPCKQCKKKYSKGDVSLCLWHPKLYCQALPYGPGFWMCCHMSQKESQGCRVGLHDNRWVSPFHSRNRPLCKKFESEFEED